MPAWKYWAVDKSQNTVAEGTVQATSWATAHAAASEDASSQGAPFYRILVADPEGN